MAAWTILARSPDRQIMGVLQGADFKLTVRHNEVGAWSLKVPYETTPQGWPDAGCGVVILRDGQVFASGVLEDDDYEWSAESGDAIGPGVYDLNGATDLALIADRIIYPIPDRAWEQYGSGTLKATHYRTSGPASTVVRRLVNLSAGFNALPSRQLPGFQLAGASGFGPTISVEERFTPLLDAMRTAALAGGGMGFELRDDLAGNLAFTVFNTVDRTDVAVFGPDANNVERLLVRRSAPVATTVLVAGPGEGVARYTVEESDTAAVARYGRRELFVDQRQIEGPRAATETEPARTDADVIAELRKTAFEALAENGEQTAVSATVIDTEAVQFGREYKLGDLVTVLTPHGPIADIVREVVIDVDSDGVDNVSSVVGTTDLSTDDPLVRAYYRINSRLSQLERAK